MKVRKMKISKDQKVKMKSGKVIIKTENQKLVYCQLAVKMSRLKFKMILMKFKIEKAIYCSKNNKFLNIKAKTMNIIK